MSPHFKTHAAAAAANHKLQLWASILLQSNTMSDVTPHYIHIYIQPMILTKFKLQFCGFEQNLAGQLGFVMTNLSAVCHLLIKQ